MAGQVSTGDDEVAQERIHQCQLAASRLELNLASLQLRLIPSNIFVLQELRTLNLRNNELEYLPRNMDLLAKLEILNLSHNRLRQLPPSMGKLKLLRKLQMNGNKLETIPPEFGGLYNLEELHISHNRIEHLPPELGELLLLQYLDVAHNQLEQIPDEIHPQNMPHLTLVNFEGNNLKQLSWSLQCLQDMYPLMLSNDLRKSMVKRSLNIRERVKQRLAAMEADAEASSPQQQLEEGAPAS